MIATKSRAGAEKRVGQQFLSFFHNINESPCIHAFTHSKESTTLVGVATGLILFHVVSSVNTDSFLSLPPSAKEFSSNFLVSARAKLSPSAVISDFSDSFM